jgi:Ca-activated chloride channel family protein
MLTYHAPDEADGYFMVVVEPRRERHEFAVIPKDIIFVVDSSSSIQPPKLERYIAGLQRCVADLNPKDRFDVVEFKTEPNRMAGQLVPVTKARLNAAKYFLDSLESGGNTNVYGAVQGLVGVRPDAQRPYMILLVTDGRANRGVVENRNIINKAAETNKNQAAIYSFAGGPKFNEYLLDLLSYRNKGESRFERNGRDVPGALYAFYQEVRDPILLNLRTQVGTVSSAEVYPKVLPDFFLKSRITICGRYRDEPEFSMQILGEVGATTKEFIFRQSFDQPDNGDARVARQWAFHKIYYLIGQMVEHGEDDATIAEIRALGKKHGIQTPYYE